MTKTTERRVTEQPSTMDEVRAMVDEYECAAADAQEAARIAVRLKQAQRNPASVVTVVLHHKEDVSYVADRPEQIGVLIEAMHQICQDAQAKANAIVRALNLPVTTDAGS